jgi:hypothetical protein
MHDKQFREELHHSREYKSVAGNKKKHRGLSRSSSVGNYNEIGKNSTSCNLFGGATRATSTSPAPNIWRPAPLSLSPHHSEPHRVITRRNSTPGGLFSPGPVRCISPSVAPGPASPAAASLFGASVLPPLSPFGPSPAASVLRHLDMEYSEGFRAPDFKNRSPRERLRAKQQSPPPKAVPVLASPSRPMLSIAEVGAGVMLTCSSAPLKPQAPLRPATACLVPFQPLADPLFSGDDEMCPASDEDI